MSAGATKPDSSAWTLRDLVLLVVLGVVFGVIYWGLVQGWIGLSVAMGPLGDLSQHFIFGGWLIVAPIAIAIIRKPLAGVFAEATAAGVEVLFLGSVAGPGLLIAGVIQGAGSELPFAATKYRRYGWWVYALSGLAGATLVFFYSAFRSGWYGQDLFWIRLIIQAISGIIIGGLLAKVVVAQLAKTGAVDNFAIGRAQSLALVAESQRHDRR